LQQTYRVVTNKFFIKINNNNNIIIIDNNFIIIKTKQLKTKNIKNCFYFVDINIKSFALNISRIALKKDVNRCTIFMRYLIIVYISKIEYICLYIRD